MQDTAQEGRSVSRDRKVCERMWMYGGETPDCKEDVPGENDDFCSLSSLSRDSYDVRSPNTDRLGVMSKFPNSQRAPNVPSATAEVCSHDPIDNTIPCHKSGPPEPVLARSKKMETTNRKPKPLSVDDQLRPAQHIHPRERVKGENRSGRLSPRQLRRRLKFPTPGDPFGPEECFGDSAIRNAKRRMGLLDLSDLDGYGLAKTTLMDEMYRKRRKMKRPDYMHHFQEYVYGRSDYVQKYRRMRVILALWRLTPPWT